MSDSLRIADREFTSRLVMGSSLYPDPQTMMDSLAASGTQMVTVAIRRLNLKEQTPDSPLALLRAADYFILPNTAGCYTAKEAVLTAQLAREALETNWVKLEVIGDDETLFPDTVELLKAAGELVDAGFVVLPYCNDDPITCRKLADLGCSAVMPLGAPIGSGMGIRNPYNLQIIRETVDIPVVVDAGVGTASDAALAMELGVDAVLLNTAVAQAKHPEQMARAMRLGVEAGRLAYRAGRIPQKLYAKASSPLPGRIGVDHD